MSADPIRRRILYIVPHAFDMPGTGAMHRSKSLGAALAACGDVEVLVTEALQAQPATPGAFARKLRELINRAAPYRAVPGQVAAVAGKIRGEKFDVVVVRYLQAWVACGMPCAPGLVLDFDDDPLEGYDSAGGVVGGNLIRRLRRSLIRRVIARQVGVARRRALQIWVANPEHERCGPQYRLVANAAPFVPERADLVPRPLRFAFFADMRYRPNIDALRWYLREVHPYLVAAAPHAELVVCGHFAPGGAENPEWQRPGLSIAGFVPDISEVYHSCAASIAPIISGSGSSVKVMESLAAGVPCIGTPMAYRGYETAVRAALPELIADDGPAFAARMLALGVAPVKGGELVARCRTFAQQHWSQKAIQSRIKGLLAELEAG